MAYLGKQFLPGQYSSEINQAAQEIRGGDPVPAEGCDPLFGPERMEEEPEQGGVGYRDPEQDLSAERALSLGDAALGTDDGLGTDLGGAFMAGFERHELPFLLSSSLPETSLVYPVIQVKMVFMQFV